MAPRLTTDRGTASGTVSRIDSSCLVAQRLPIILLPTAPSDPGLCASGPVETGRRAKRYCRPGRGGRGPRPPGSAASSGGLILHVVVRPAQEFRVNHGRQLLQRGAIARAPLAQQAGDIHGFLALHSAPTWKYIPPAGSPWQKCQNSAYRRARLSKRFLPHGLLGLSQGMAFPKTAHMGRTGACIG
jgi:hypothetical protein